jgi:hypothetical protein
VNGVKCNRKMSEGTAANYHPNLCDEGNFANCNIILYMLCSQTDSMVHDQSVNIATSNNQVIW